jgi:hypothetical protein
VNEKETYKLIGGKWERFPFTNLKIGDTVCFGGHDDYSIWSVISEVSTEGCWLAKTEESTSVSRVGIFGETLTRQTPIHPDLLRLKMHTYEQQMQEGITTLEALGATLVRSNVWRIQDLEFTVDFYDEAPPEKPWRCTAKQLATGEAENPLAAAQVFITKLAALEKAIQSVSQQYAHLMVNVNLDKLLAARETTP